MVSVPNSGPPLSIRRSTRRSSAGRRNSRIRQSASTWPTTTGVRGHNVFIRGGYACRPGGSMGIDQLLVDQPSFRRRRNRLTRGSRRASPLLLSPANTTDHQQSLSPLEKCRRSVLLRLRSVLLQSPPRNAVQATCAHCLTRRLPSTDFNCGFEHHRDANFSLPLRAVCARDIREAGNRGREICSLSQFHRVHQFHPTAGTRGRRERAR